MRPTDVHLSAHRFIAELLGPPWTVRAEQRRVTLPDDERPFAAVTTTGPVATAFARETIPQGDVRRSLSLVAVLYPAVGPTPADARRAADDLVDLIDAAMLVGVVVPATTTEPERSLSRPLTVPLWDWRGVPTTGAGRGGPLYPISTATVEDHGAQAIRDDEDDRRWTVAATFRLSWWAGGRDREVTAQPPVVSSITGTAVQ